MPERDPMTFESRLADAFDRYVAAAPVDVDALSLAAVVATGSRRAGPMFGRPRPRTVRLALVLGLLAVAAFGAALMAGALLRAQPGPLGGGGRLMVFSNGTAHVLDVDGTVVVSRSVATRSGGCPRLVAGGTGFAASDFGGLRVSEITAPGKATMLATNYTGGERWSSDGRVLARVAFTEGITFSTFPDGPAGDPVDVHVPLTGIAPPEGLLDAGLKADGSTLAVLTAPTENDATITLIDSATGAHRVLGTYPVGAVLPSLWEAWSADGTHLVMVGEGPDGVLTAWVIDAADGSTRTMVVGQASSYQTVRLSPDGTRILLVTDAGVEIRDVQDGAVIARVPGTREDEVAWGPDGAGFSRIGGTLNADGRIARDGVLHVHAADGSLLRDIPLHNARTTWSPDRSVLATIADDGRLVVYHPWLDAVPQQLATVGIGTFDDATCIEWIGDLP